MECPNKKIDFSSTLLKAMACGISVLATLVRAIPDVIIDGKTGFIMENNSPDVEQIAEDSRRFRGKILRLNMWLIGGTKIPEEAWTCGKRYYHTFTT